MTLFIYSKKKDVWAFRNDELKTPIGKKRVKRYFINARPIIENAFIFNDLVYLLKGENYFKYNTQRLYLGSGKRSSLNLPRDINAAFFHQKSNSTYFFIKKFYFKFDYKNNRIDQSVHPPYPRSIDTWIYKCRSKSRLLPENIPTLDYRTGKNFTNQTHVVLNSINKFSYFFRHTAKTKKKLRGND